MNNQPSVPLSIGLRVGHRADSLWKVGTIRFIGTTQFSNGVWVGIELDQPEGKNDGSIGGIRYFECVASSSKQYQIDNDSLYGLFVRPNSVKPLSEIDRLSGTTTPIMQRSTSSTMTKKVCIGSLIYFLFFFYDN